MISWKELRHFYSEQVVYREGHIERYIGLWLLNVVNTYILCSGDVTTIDIQQYFLSISLARR